MRKNFTTVILILLLAVSSKQVLATQVLLLANDKSVSGTLEDVQSKIMATFDVSAETIHMQPHLIMDRDSRINYDVIDVTAGHYIVKHRRN